MECIDRVNMTSGFNIDLLAVWCLLVRSSAGFRWPRIVWAPRLSGGRWKPWKNLKLRSVLPSCLPPQLFSNSPPHLQRGHRSINPLPPSSPGSLSPFKQLSALPTLLFLLPCLSQSSPTNCFDFSRICLSTPQFQADPDYHCHPQPVG